MTEPTGINPRTASLDRRGAVFYGVTTGEVRPLYAHLENWYRYVGKDQWLAVYGVPDVGARVIPLTGPDANGERMWIVAPGDATEDDRRQMADATAVQLSALHLDSLDSGTREELDRLSRVAQAAVMALDVFVAAARER